jgi:hypothetical protein
MDLVASGSSISSIQIFTRASHDVNISTLTIYFMRNEHMNDIVNACSLYPAGSSVDKLTALFKNIEKFSCVYLLHKYDTDFAHFRKNKKKFEELLIEDTLAQKAFGHNKKSIKN